MIKHFLHAACPITLTLKVTWLNRIRIGLELTFGALFNNLGFRKRCLYFFSSFSYFFLYKTCLSLCMINCISLKKYIVSVCFYIWNLNIHAIYIDIFLHILCLLLSAQAQVTNPVLFAYDWLLVGPVSAIQGWNSHGDQTGRNQIFSVEMLARWKVLTT